MAKLKVDGLDKIEKRLRHNVEMSDVKRIVRFHGSSLQRTMQRNADFKGHFEWVAGKGKVFKIPTGQTKRSIGLEMKDSGFTAEVGPETEYSPYLEYGTRFMEAQPFIKPALDDVGPKFHRDLRKLVW